jgi:5-methylcytosine-specific restriction enzyme A
VAQHGPSLAEGGRSRPAFRAFFRLARESTMASLPKHPCHSPGCRALCDGERYCPEHSRQKQHEQDQRRGTSAERGYDADHRRLRVLCFIRDEWRCVDCGWEPNVVADFRRFELGPPPVEQVLAELRERFSRGEKHLHADHQIPIEERPDLRLSLDNLRTRCNGCHAAKTMRESVNPIRNSGVWSV